MDQKQLKELLDLFYLVTFTLGILAINVRLWLRVLEYRKARERPPKLFWRDLLFFNGLGIPFIAILIARATGLGGAFRDEVSWSILTGTPAVIAVWFWFGVEQFGLQTKK